MKLGASLSGFFSRATADSAGPVTSRAVNRLLQPLGQPRELDPWLIWSAAALLLLGLIMVFSASIATAEGSRMFGHQPAYFLIRHAVFLAIGVIAGVVVFQIPMRAWQEMAPWLFIAGVVLLLVVLIPGIGRDVNGARRWLPLGVVNLQPSELMKLFAALYAADYTTRKLPLMGSFAFGNFVKESGCIERLTKTMQNELMNLATIFLGLGVGMQMSAGKFLNLETLGILLLGLGSMLLSELLGLSDLVLRFLKLCGELIDLLLLTLSHDHLLLGRCQLTGQVLGLCAERVTLVLHGGKLLAKVGLTGRFGCLGGELIDLRGQTIDLPLELLVLGRQRTIAFLCLGKLGGRGLSGLSGLVSRTSCLLGGGLQRRVLLLQGLNLSAELGNLGVELGDVGRKGLRRLATCNGLLAKRLDGFRHLIEKIVNLVDIIAFLETHGLEGMLPYIFRRQKSHKTYTSLWARCLAVLVSPSDASTNPERTLAVCVITARFTPIFSRRQVRCTAR